MDSFKITSPFDRHGHLREFKTLMNFVLKYTAQQFWGMVAMPNLSIPITTWQQAKAYYDEIMYVAQKNGFSNFTPVMTAYLTDNIEIGNLKEGFRRNIWKAAKLYPFGATTNSDAGVTKLENIFRVLEVMQDINMPLLVHPETDISRRGISFFDRERVFTEESLEKIHKEFPKLIISVEHISTKEACQFVENSGPNVVGTITPQHIMYDHNALFDGGAPPFKAGMYTENMCLPVLKYPSDVAYIKNAIMYGLSRNKFGAGTDTAPHDQVAKHEACSRCGIFNATNAVEFYAMVFESNGMFENEKRIKVFEDFMSVNNLWVYQLEASTKLIELRKEPQMVPDIIPGNIRPFKAGQTIPWRIYNSVN